MQKINSLKMSHKIIIGLVLLLTGIVLLNLLIKGEPRVNSVQPEPRSSGLGLDPEIKINFKTAPGSLQKQQLKYQISPKVPFQTQWNKNQLIISFKQTLEPEQTYTSTILFQNKTLFEWSLRTKTISQLNPAEQKKIQTKWDLDFSQALEERDKKYLWLKNLPLTGENYSVVYDYQQEKLSALISFKEQAGLSREAQLEQIKTTVTKELQEIGVDLNQVEIEWKTKL